MARYKNKKTTYRKSNTTYNKGNKLQNININENAKPGSFEYTINGFKEAFLVFADIFKSITGIFKRDKGTSDKSSNKLFNKYSKNYDKSKNKYNKKNEASILQNNMQMQTNSNANIGKRIIVNYEQFKHDCDMCKKNIGDRGKGTIQNVNLKDNTCEVTTHGNTITMSIPEVVKTVSVNHNSWISNPSKLTQWRGWKEAELW